MGQAAFQFVGRVLRARSLRGFEIQAFWSIKNAKIHLRARHPYGSWHDVTISHVERNGATCLSENGAPMCASDVVFRLRRSMMDKGPKRKGTSEES